MPFRVIDMTGKRYTRLVAVELVPKEKAPRGANKSRYWLCRCDCGNDVIVQANHLRDGKTKSCGCLRREKMAAMANARIAARAKERGVARE